MKKIDFGSRKLARQGEGSYIVSLPRKLVESQHLKSGDMLGVGLRSDGVIMLAQNKDRLHSSICDTCKAKPHAPTKDRISPDLRQEFVRRARRNDVPLKSLAVMFGVSHATIAADISILNKKGE